jgi:5'-nucleotidase
MVWGDVLIDDKGIITAAAITMWEHLVHGQSHNRSVTRVPRMRDWREWRGHANPLLDRVPA